MYSPPNYSNEIEISVFGSGIGEAVAFQFKKEWILIDSCFNNKVCQPTTLHYLKELSVNYAEDVKLIIITHWHDDHIKGALELIRHCSRAKVIIPPVFKSEDFRKLSLLYLRSGMIFENGVEEITKIIYYLINKRRDFNIGGVDTLFYKSNNVGTDLSVYGISPSPAVPLNELISLSYILENNPQRIPNSNHNLASVATLVNVDDLFLLFGADLEYDEHDTEVGWQHVLHKCGCINGDKSSFYKISHHGSSTGDHPEIWSKLLNYNPYAFVTPHKKGKYNLPSEKDILRIKKNTSNGFVSGKPTSKIKDNNLLKCTDGMLNDLCNINQKNSFVRLRIDSTSKEHKVNLFNGAYKIT